MKSTTFIYTLSDMNGDIRYIGKSNTPRKRLYSHIKECKTSKHILNKEELYKKYIIENLSLNKCASFFKISKATVFINLKEHGISKSKEIWKEQLSSKPKKIVLQYDLDGELIREWDCLVDISRGIRISINLI
jgi:hypothetical protein